MGVAIGVDLACFLVNAAGAPEIAAMGIPSSSMVRRKVTSAIGSWVHSGESLKRLSRRGPSKV